MYYCKNSTCYILLKMAICICIKKCSFKFWTCSNLIIFCSISVFIFLHFLTLCERPCTSHSWFQAIDLIWFYPLPSILPRKKPIKMCFYSTCLSCFWKQILRPLFPRLISVAVPGRLIFFSIEFIHSSLF